MSGNSPKNVIHGFSLIDFIILLMILGVIGMVVTPIISNIASETKLNAATGELVSGLQYAENLAITHQRPFCVSAEAAGNWFRVLDQQYIADPNPHHDSDPPVDANGLVLNPFDKKWYDKDFDTLSEYEGVKIASVPAGGTICFYPDGHSASTDSTFALGNGAQQKTININGITGRISVQ